MEELPVICNQENQLLLKAIKCKFAAQNSGEMASFSPPKFNIPSLKSLTIGERNSDATDQPPSVQTFGTKNTVTSSGHISTYPVSKLNEFISKQLEAKSRVLEGEIFLSKFYTNHMEEATLSKKLLMGESKSGCHSGMIDKCDFGERSLSIGFNDMKISKERVVAKPTIDLTSALSNNSLSGTSSSYIACNRTASKDTNELEDFDIPFIACDLKEKLLPSTEELCQPDMSNVKLRPCLTAPSPFARITCLKLKNLRDLPLINHKFKAKYKIQRFRFDTKSPDDLVLASFQKYQR